MTKIGRVLTAMATPFRDDGSLDLDGAQQLARHLCDTGSEGLIVAGTTGEAPTLTDTEKVELFRAVKQAVGDAAVVAGTGTNDTRHSVHLSEQAMAVGADALLGTVPYYNKPAQEGMYQHFRAMSQVGPVIMYNIRGRTGINMTAETTLRCAAEPGIVGVKESSGDLDQIGAISGGAPQGFEIWSGDDNLLLPVLAIGGYGVISVAAHVAGLTIRRMIDAHLEGRPAEARDLHLALLPLCGALLGMASNPMPLKSLLRHLGFRVGPFRLPMTDLPAADLERLAGLARSMGDLLTLAEAVSPAR
ncbi:MAG TPA: 4-hydroxy-tetrahydrodipicolinate synthase [Candidatus Dormibacteraeota bacterium]|nr:4-hydroxy-tetrahydrodipicolinate synthase [Candidatus Dormibacteraeota bacterium]